MNTVKSTELLTAFIFLFIQTVLARNLLMAGVYIHLLGKRKAICTPLSYTKKLRKKWEGEKFRKSFTDGDPDKEANFYVLRHTNCPAILSENFFMTNERECKKFLLSEQGRIDIAEVHFNMITNL